MRAEPRLVIAALNLADTVVPSERQTVDTLILQSDQYDLMRPETQLGETRMPQREDAPAMPK